MRNINKIIVHCSATPEGKAFSVADIRRWHLQRGFSDIGYHFVVYLDGSVHVGRPLHKSGAHCIGQNKNSVGVCYIGGLAADGITPADTRTEAQKVALQKLLADLKLRYPKALVLGHCELDYRKPHCPGFDAAELRG